MLITEELIYNKYEKILFLHEVELLPTINSFLLSVTCPNSQIYVASAPRTDPRNTYGSDPSRVNATHIFKQQLQPLLSNMVLILKKLLYGKLQ